MEKVAAKKVTGGNPEAFSFHGPHLKYLCILQHKRKVLRNGIFKYYFIRSRHMNICVCV